MQKRAKRVHRLALKSHSDKIPQKPFGSFATQLPGFGAIPSLGHQVHQRLLQLWRMIVVSMLCWATYLYVMRLQSIGMSGMQCNMCNPQLLMLERVAECLSATVDNSGSWLLPKSHWCFCNVLWTASQNRHCSAPASNVKPCKLHAGGRKIGKMQCDLQADPQRCGSVTGIKIHYLQFWKICHVCNSADG